MAYYTNSLIYKWHTKQVHSYTNSIYTYRVGQKLLYMDFPKWASPEQLFAVSSENTDFPKKLFNMKIFSIKFLIKKVILIFGVRWLLLLKNAHVSPKCFKPVCNNFWAPCIRKGGNITSQHLHINVGSVILYASHIYHHLRTKYWYGECMPVAKGLRFA